jgi:hypothetical protein
MPKRVMSRVPAVVGLLAAAIMLSTSSATRADDCLAGPNRPPAPGGHWYFHLDRAANRKCWYLVEPETRTPIAEAPETQPVPDVPPRPQSAFGSFFSLMGLPGTTSAPQPDTTNGARMMPNTRPDDVRNDDTAPTSRPRIAGHPNAQAALAPKQHRASPAKLPADHADERPAPPDQAERDALFQEFLRWRERKAQ